MPKVINREPNIRFISCGKGEGDVTLKPGVNVIPQDRWELAKKTAFLVPDPASSHKKVRKSVVDVLIEAGSIQVLSQPHEKADETSLEGVPDPESIAMAKATYDLPTLHAFLHNEKRPAVKAALEAQLAEINRPPTDEEKKARELEGEPGLGSPRVEADEEGGDEEGDGNLKVTMPHPSVRRPNVRRGK